MKTTEKEARFAIEINYTICGNCGACVAVCPTETLHLGTMMLTSQNENCTGCKFCIITCPSDALILHAEK